MERDMLESTARQFRAAAQAYREIAGGVERTLDREPAPAGAEQIVRIVRGSCLPYILAGADAIDEAAARMEHAAVEGVVGDAAPDAGQRDEPMPFFTPLPDGMPLGFAMAQAARMLEDLLKLLAELAEAVGDRELAGDTHPYVDMIHGIVVPYLGLLAG